MKHRSSAKINTIETTNDTISGRGGLALFMRYVQQTNFYVLIELHLSELKMSKKGLPLFQLVKQMIAFFIDRTFTAISGFDQLKQDGGYAAVLENSVDEMASSHQIKRFFRKLMLNKISNNVYRKILHELFIWRLKIEAPSIIILGADTMVLNNDDALKREGVEPTYKKKKGYQPLHISWGPFLIDVWFRSGSKHSNHGTDFQDAMCDIVELIRSRYNPDVPVIVVADSGFFDQKNFGYFEEKLGIFYIITGKMYDDIKEYLNQTIYNTYRKFGKNRMWSYIEFGNKLKSWKKFRRTIFTTLETDDNDQFCLEFVKTDMLLYTNIGLDEKMTKSLINAGGEKYISADSIISLAHQRGRDELIHRSIKELALKEQLPFQHLIMNRGYYYFLTFAHFLFECYKRDITHDVLPISSYPNTFRRQIIDFAAKVVSHSDQIVLRVTTTIYNRLNILQLWERCQAPPVISFS